MESLSVNEQQNLILSFLEIAVGQTAETARQYLLATNGKVEEAIELLYAGNEGASNHPITHVVGQDGGDELRPPLPVVRDKLYDNDMLSFWDFEEQTNAAGAGVWEYDEAASTADTSRHNLASLYRPPLDLMFNGSFEKAKVAAYVEDKWLLVNLQSTKEFTSHMLNRDTWANEAVSQTVSTNFIFWQAYDDTREGVKVCSYYKLDSIPVVLVIDPITGQKMRSWCGMVEPENLLEDLVPYMDGGPRDHLAGLSHKQQQRGISLTPQQKFKDETGEEDKQVAQAMVTEKEEITSTSTPKKQVYPDLPEEPKGSDRELICRVAFRLPDGRRTQRKFVASDPIQLLWSFCYSQLLLLEGSSVMRPFRLAHAIPGAPKSLDYDAKLTIQESGLSSSVISVTWD